MARTITRAQLVARVRQRADVQNDPHVDAAEVIDLLNEKITRVWDLLVMAAPPDYYTTDIEYTTATAQESYDLPLDFYKVRRVWEVIGTRVKPLDYIDDSQRHLFETATGGQTVRLRYIQCAPTLDDDAATFDGVNGWEELIVLDAAIDILNKQERNPAALLERRAGEERRIQGMAFRDAGSPGKIRRKMLVDPYTAWTGQLTAYMPLGDSICFYRQATDWP